MWLTQSDSGSAGLGSELGSFQTRIKFSFSADFVQGTRWNQSSFHHVNSIFKMISSIKHLSEIFSSENLEWNLHIYHISYLSISLLSNWKKTSAFVWFVTTENKVNRLITCIVISSWKICIWRKNLWSFSQLINQFYPGAAAGTSGPESVYYPFLCFLWMQIIG